MWKKMKAIDFKYHSKPIYKEGFILNFIENTIVSSSCDLKETVYIQYEDGLIVGAIRVNKNSFNHKFVSILKTSCSFHIRSLYSKTLEEAKLKSDIFLIEQGFEINFPGV